MLVALGVGVLALMDTLAINSWNSGGWASSCGRWFLDRVSSGGLTYSVHALRFAARWRLADLFLTEMYACGAIGHEQFCGPMHGVVGPYPSAHLFRQIYREQRSQEGHRRVEHLWGRKP